MPRDDFILPRLVLALGLAAIGLACVPRLPFTGIAPDVLTAAEARKHLINARRLLYQQDPIDPSRAIQLCKRVIDVSEVDEYIWDAYFIKTNALQIKGRTDRAAEVAAEGIEHVLISQIGPPTDGALAALNQLLPAYVQNAVAIQPRRVLLLRLDAWEAELAFLFRLEEPVDEARYRAVQKEFEVFKQLVEEKVAEREPESRAREAVKQYIELFNAGELEKLLELGKDESPYLKTIESEGARGFASEGVTELHLAGALIILIDEVDLEKAIAQCDLLAIGRRGYASLAREVRFELVQKPDGRWLIRNIVNHP